MEDPILSVTGTRTLKALSYLASLGEGEFADSAAIATRINAPPNYLGKLLGKLGRAGILASRKGIQGGFRLARPSADISLYELLEPVERVVREDDCILGNSKCGGKAACPLHAEWAVIRAQMILFLRGTSLASLGGRLL